MFFLAATLVGWIDFVYRKVAANNIFLATASSNLWGNAIWYKTYIKLFLTRGIFSFSCKPWHYNAGTANVVGQLLLIHAFLLLFNTRAQKGTDEYKELVNDDRSRVSFAVCR